MNRLRVRLTLAFTLVILVAVGSIAILVIRTTDTQFRRYITHSGMQASGSGIQQLIEYYELRGSWEGVEQLLGQGVFLSAPSAGIASPFPGLTTRFFRAPERLDVLLADGNGRIVYDSTGEDTGRKLRSRDKSQALPLSQEGEEKPIGYLLLSFPGEPERLGGPEQQFLDRMRSILITAAALAVAVGLAIGALLSRSLTAPLQRLARAARAVAGGDLEQQVQVEGSAEMVEVAHAFNEMTAALGASEQQRQNMVADVAHELRTPLTVLQGNLRAILDGMYSLDLGEISRLYDETLLLTRLVDDLRALALADARQLRLNLRATNAGQLVQTTVESLLPAAQTRDLSLTARVPEEPLLVQADADRIAQVLHNLMMNALRHTPPGGAVTVTVQPNGKAVEVTVADTGEGIAAEDLPHIFERFWKADPARARDPRVASGSGLGLCVAQSLVEAHGGRIWAESTPGEGSTFHFTLPLEHQFVL